MNLKNDITKIIKKTAEKLNYDDLDKIVVSFSNRPELCDFQTNYAMLIAKKMEMKPIDVANKIVESVGENDDFEFSAVMPGFINVKVKDKMLSKVSNFVLNDENLGVEKVKNPRLVFFDYGGANVAKELHV